MKISLDIPEVITAGTIGELERFLRKELAYFIRDGAVMYRSGNIISVEVSSDDGNILTKCEKAISEAIKKWMLSVI